MHYGYPGQNATPTFLSAHDFSNLKVSSEEKASWWDQDPAPLLGVLVGG